MTTHCSFGLFIFVSLISDQLQFIICLTYSESLSDWEREFPS
jgi:hypothetical protein